MFICIFDCVLFFCCLWIWISWFLKIGWLLDWNHSILIESSDLWFWITRVTNHHKSPDILVDRPFFFYPWSKCQHIRCQNMNILSRPNHEGAVGSMFPINISNLNYFKNTSRVCFVGRLNAIKKHFSKESYKSNML